MSNRSDPVAPRPTAFVRPLSVGRFLLVMLLVAVGTAALLMALPTQPYLRFQSLKDTIYNRATWIYERIHFDEAPIDVVFVGSSRTGAGVYPTLLEPALAARGYNVRVVNFALPATGFDIRDTILREVFAARDGVKLVVFDVSEVFPRDGHEAFGDIAPVGEILSAPLIVNRNLPEHIARLPIRQLGLGIASLAPEAFGYRSQFDPAAYPGTTIDPRSLLKFEDDLTKLGTPEHAQKLEQQSKQRYRSVTPPLLPDSLSWVEFGVSQSYIRDIAALTKAEGAEIAFLFLPFYKGPDAPREAAWLSGFGPVLNAAFMKDDPRNYEDSGHSAASPEVKAMLTAWLANQLADILKE